MTIVILKSGYHGNADRTHCSDQSMDIHSANDKKTIVVIVMSG
jgi:hypothetical protein